MKQAGCADGCRSSPVARDPGFAVTAPHPCDDRRIQTTANCCRMPRAERANSLVSSARQPRSCSQSTRRPPRRRSPGAERLRFFKLGLRARGITNLQSVHRPAVSNASRPARSDRPESAKQGQAPLQERQAGQRNRQRPDAPGRAHSMPDASPAWSPVSSRPARWPPSSVAYCSWGMSASSIHTRPSCTSARTVTGVIVLPSRLIDRARLQPGRRLRVTRAERQLTCRPQQSSLE